MKALVGAFNQEKALVGAFSVIVKTDCGTNGALHSTTDYCVTVLFRLRGTLLPRPGLSDEDGRYGHHQPDLEQSGSKHLCSGGFLNSHLHNLSIP